MLKVAYALCAVAAFAAAPASATIVTVFNSVPTGQSSFDTTVTNAGGTVSTQQLSSGQVNYTDFTISKSPITSYAEITGDLTNIAPSSRDIAASRSSGVTFTFKGPINSFGLNVGDWGTCCYPSSLYIAFDGGAPILVGTANSSGDVPRTNGSFSMFTAAFDDSGQFTKVEFWGDGEGEVLYGGGTIRYALLDQGTLPGVPEPATWALMILGFGAVGGAMRRRSAAKLALA